MKNNALKGQLFKAVQYDDTDKAIKIIQSGIFLQDLNIYNEFGNSLLNFAVTTRNIDVIKCLLEYGANPDIKRSNGESPLHSATFSGSLEIVKILLQGDANPNSVNRRQCTPLHIAAYHGYVDIAQIFLENGADHELLNEDGQKPYDCAIEYEHAEMANLLQSWTATKQNKMLSELIDQSEILNQPGIQRPRFSGI